MNYATGDIVINNNGTWGHALMCYEGGSRPKFIHATNSGDFHIDALMSEKGGQISYLFDRNCDHFRAKNLSGAQQVQLKWVADQIAARAKYGLYRAVRLAMGSSAYGPKARERLEKYRSRLRGAGAAEAGDDESRGGGAAGGGRVPQHRRTPAIFSHPDAGAAAVGDKLVTTLTCSEAVVLCYQLTFVDSAEQFILLDGAHALPRTVAKYLKSNANWGHTSL